MRRFSLIAAIATTAITAASAQQQSRTPVPVEPWSLHLAIDRQLAWRDYPRDINDAADRQIMQAGFGSTNADVRAIAIRGVGRFQDAANVPGLLAYLTDSNAGIRMEAAYAIVQSLTKVQGAAVVPVMEALKNSFVATSPGAVLETIGRLRYDAPTAEKVEAWLETARNAMRLAQSTPKPETWVPSGIVQALSDIARLQPNRSLLASSIVMLQNALHEEGNGPLVPNAMALEALRSSLPADSQATLDLLSTASRFLCKNPSAGPMCGWEFRMAAVKMMTPRVPEFAEALDRAAHDVAFQVRLAALQRFSSDTPRTNYCKPMLDAMANDDEPYVVVRLEAIRYVNANCTEREAIVEKLKALTAEPTDGRPRDRWHIRARAFEALGRLEPAAVTSFLETAPTHEVWQMRAAAARISGVVKDEATALKLTRDAEANVQTDALKALIAMRSPKRFDEAVRSLESKDYQLVMTAANGLNGAPQPQTVVTELLRALKRLTFDNSDTSRDPRVAILKRIAAFGVDALRPNTTDADFVPYLKDVEPEVANAAADILALRNGTRPPPAPTRRPIEQPTADELRELRKTDSVIVDMANGDWFVLDLLWKDAPLTAARFVKLVKARHFDGLTFHRVEPLFVVQGGSPGANEYSGASRYERDEIGLSQHLRGAVGISTRGTDRGDTQIFIDLIDLPRLSYLYTVFANVAPLVIPPFPDPLPSQQKQIYAVDAILEGATIAKMTPCTRNDPRCAPPPK